MALPFKSFLNKSFIFREHIQKHLKYNGAQKSKFVFKLKYMVLKIFNVS